MQYLTFNNQLLMLFVMIIMTLITLYFYICLCYTTFMLNYFENNWNFNIYWNNLSMNIYLFCSFISSFGLFIISSTYYLI